MARQIDRLSPATVDSKKLSPGRHADGNGLYLIADESGRRRWLFMYRSGLTSAGKPKRVEMGLGTAGRAGLGLAEARRKAADARRLLLDGINPLHHKREQRAAESESFGKFAERYINDVVAREAKNDKHLAQWRMTVLGADAKGEPTKHDYCKSLRSKALNTITTEDVLQVLRPIWDSKRETASRLRGRIARVLDAAKVAKKRSGDNPAAWVGHLDQLLAKKREKAGNHSAIPYTKLPAFMIELCKRNSISASALEFTILCAARTGETIGATWAEIDLDRKVWTIPDARMKAGKEHRVPLSDRSIAILESVRTPNTKATDYVFPGAQRNKPLSNMAMLELLRGLHEGTTVHGFRSSFSTWCTEATDHDPETREFCLAHIVGDKAQQAYQRGTSLNKRRAVLVDWAEFLKISRT
jgi:integrase